MKLVRKILERTDRSGECWEWVFSTSSSGYGQLSVNGKPVNTHRLVAKLMGWEIPEGHIVCHHCDNRRCCRPSHLYVGTRAQNTADMMRRGRQNNRPLHGEENPTARLSNAEVAEIRALYRTGKFRQVDLVRRFNASKNNISGILSGARRKQSYTD